MKKVLRMCIPILMMAFLLIACDADKENALQTNDEVKTQSEEIMAAGANNEDELLGEEYEILSVHVGNYPNTGPYGSYSSKYYNNFISFCYIGKNGEPIFETLAINATDGGCKYEVHCGFGEKNKVVIVFQKYGREIIKTTYSIYLTKETYENIYDT